MTNVMGSAKGAYSLFYYREKAYLEDIIEKRGLLLYVLKLAFFFTLRPLERSRMIVVVHKVLSGCRYRPIFSAGCSFALRWSALLFKFKCATLSFALYL